MGQFSGIAPRPWASPHGRGGGSGIRVDPGANPAGGGSATLPPRLHDTVSPRCGRLTRDLCIKSRSRDTSRRLCTRFTLTSSLFFAQLPPLPRPLPAAVVARYAANPLGRRCHVVRWRPASARTWPGSEWRSSKRLFRPLTAVRTFRPKSKWGGGKASELTQLAYFCFCDGDEERRGKSREGRK